MDLDARLLDGVLVVRPRCDRIDLHNCADLEKHVSELIEEGNLRVLLNLEDVTFVDSAGISTLVWIQRFLDGRGTFSVCCLRPAPRQVMSMTRMDRLLDIVDTEEQALLAMSLIP